MTGNKQKNCEHCKTNRSKKRTEDEKKMLINRLNRVVGQINGIKRMLEEDAYCADILIQASATTAAINSFSKMVISSHLKTCVHDDIKNGNEESMNEFLKLLSKLLK